MKLIIIRHGESLADILKVNEGRADFELTEKGKLQASCLAEDLIKNYKIDKLFSSTLKRAKQTTEIIAEKYAIEPIYLDDLMEFNNGKLAGLSNEVSNILYPDNKNLEFDKSMYEMESLKEFRERADKVLNHILSNFSSSKTIAIVSHGGMINRLYQSFLEMDIQVNTKYPTGDTGYHIWEIRNKVRSIISSNIQKHTENI